MATPAMSTHTWFTIRDTKHEQLLTGQVLDLTAQHAMGTWVINHHLELDMQPTEEIEACWAAEYADRYVVEEVEINLAGELRGHLEVITDLTLRLEQAQRLLNLPPAWLERHIDVALEGRLAAKLRECEKANRKTHVGAKLSNLDGRVRLLEAADRGLGGEA